MPMKCGCGCIGNMPGCACAFMLLLTTAEEGDAEEVVLEAVEFEFELELDEAAARGERCGMEKAGMSHDDGSAGTLSAGKVIGGTAAESSVSSSPSLMSRDDEERSAAPVALGDRASMLFGNPGRSSCSSSSW